MSASSPHILLVEDDLSMARVYQAYLEKDNFTVTHCERGSDAMSALASDMPDAVLLDLKLPDMHGFEILRHIANHQLPTEVIIITGTGSMRDAIEAMKLGARDFLVKPFDKDRLLTTLTNSLERQELKRIVETYREEIDRNTYAGFIGSSLPMQAVYRIIDAAAGSKGTVFITGESGTGKEVCAQAIHERSPRSHGPFVAINCGAIPKDLMESEIFGHIKGSFTGAYQDRDGAAKRANGGTLFLDEIGEMDLSLQPKLLRFLQTGTVQRVGSPETESVDVRIVCATNRDPLEEVRMGRFREDLYYRLHVIPIFLPPLRDREGDVLEIARSFLLKYAQEEQRQFQSFDADVESIIVSYGWPGNVRELQNVMRNVVVLHDAEVVSREMLPPPLNSFQAGPGARVGQASDSPMRRASDHSSGGGQFVGEAAEQDPAAEPISLGLDTDSGSSDPSKLIRPIADIEREAIERAINICDGNIPQAAVFLGISAATVYRKKAAWKKAG